MHELESSARKIAHEWEAAWNSHDMPRMGKLLAEDADFVNVHGKHMKGAAQIVSVHAALHETRFRESTWKNNELQARLLAPAVGLVHLKWSIRGDFDPDGTPRTPRSGVFSWLLIEASGRWRIHAAHNTNVVVLPSAEKT